MGRGAPRLLGKAYSATTSIAATKAISAYRIRGRRGRHGRPDPAGNPRGVKPVRASFGQAAPWRHDQFVETVGNIRIEFGALTDRLGFRVADLARPLTTADPMPAEIYG
ncbi:hypothetical protein ACWEKR_33325 [Nocardia sp. NPDC004573]